jgi:two-component sensor histidine kinase/PAS domain-containing protein
VISALQLDLVADTILAVALLLVSLTLLAGLYRSNRMRSRLLTASTLIACGLSAIALSILLPYLFPSIHRTSAELLIKFLAAGAFAGASLIVWPLLRRALFHRQLSSILVATELQSEERGDLAMANTELERRVIRRSYELERANRQMRLALLGSTITVFRQDRELRYTWIFNEPPHTTQLDFIGRTDAEIYAADVAFAVSEVKKRAMATGEEQSSEVNIRSPHGARWYYLRSQPDYDTDGRTIGTISCAVDITEQKEQQLRQQLLMREVTHRSKNLLAVLQGVVRQTARRTRNLDEFIAKFTARLQSIASSHDLLVNDDWSGTSIVRLFRSQLGVFSEIEAGRVTLNGPDILINSVAVQNLGLAIHELATNAVKYGALSSSKGMVDVSWAIVTLAERSNAQPAGEYLHLTWRETAGPSVPSLNEGGFGRTLLERVVGQALGGRVTLDFAHAGLVCSMMLPVTRVMAKRELEAAPLREPNEPETGASTGAIAAETALSDQ